MITRNDIDVKNLLIKNLMFINHDIYISDKQMQSTLK